MVSTQSNCTLPFFSLPSPQCHQLDVESLKNSHKAARIRRFVLRAREACCHQRNSQAHAYTGGGKGMDRFNGINSRSKNWYNLARRVPCEPRPIPPYLCLHSMYPLVCRQSLPGTRCLTWAFLHESLYLRERARNINPGLVHEPTRPPVPQRELRLNPMEHEDLNEGRVANWFRHKLLSCGLIWQRVEGICRRFGNR